MWTSPGEGGAIDVFQAPPAGPGRVLQSVQPEPTTPQPTSVSGSLIASPTHWMLGTAGYTRLPTREVERLYIAYYRGRASGPADRLTTCEQSDAALSFDVSGDAYVYRECGRPTPVQVRDEGEPPLSPARSTGRGGVGTVIAGRFVAWLDGEYNPAVGDAGRFDVAVYDRVADREVYRIPAASGRGPITALDLDDDGTLVVVHDTTRVGESDTQGVAWASVAEPRLHSLPLPAAARYLVRIAGGVIAFQRVQRPDGEIDPAVAGLANLSGRERVITRAAEAPPGFDYDGRRLTWVHLNCESADIVVRDAADGPSRERPRGPCRLRLKRRIARSGNQVTFVPSCAGFAEARCEAVGKLSTRGRRPRRIASGRGTEAGVRLRVTRAGATLLRRSPRQRLTLSVRLTDDTGRTDVRRATVAIGGG